MFGDTLLVGNAAPYGTLASFESWMSEAKVFHHPKTLLFPPRMYLEFGTKQELGRDFLSNAPGSKKTI